MHLCSGAHDQGMDHYTLDQLIHAHASIHRICISFQWDCLCVYVSCVRNFVCVHLQMFDNISKLKFVQGPGGESIASAMISSEGEMMEYRKGVTAEGKARIMPCLLSL